MGKIVMPKNSALLNEIEAVLDIYYHNDGWMPNEDYKSKLKSMIGDDQYSSSYTKKSQITSYFGFTEWEDIHNPQSRRRITESGKRMYEALKENNIKSIQDILMSALETVKFGRDNFGCPDSNSDVEPPSLYIRAILDLGYLTYREFAFLLWKLEDIGANYTDALKDLRNMRSRGIIDIGDEAVKYTDCKPIMILVRWGFLSEDDSSNSGGKHIIINPDVLYRFKSRLKNLKIYNVDMDDLSVTVDSDEYRIQKSDRLTDGTNILLYGVPGCGKSHTIKTEYCDDETHMERAVFHPDYTYSDFVGQILPKVEGEKVKYEFTPGPFTRIMKKAHENPSEMFYLVIEEINRGNAPAIFGDIFQLLDRDEYGISEYGVSNANVAKEVYGDEEIKVKIPGNLYVLATMNTSDQNVFTLDTAFKRRWSLKRIENVIDGSKYADIEICSFGVTWGTFAKAINHRIVELSESNFGNEDNRLGAYFVYPADLEDAERFGEKVLMYLWNDAFKLDRERVFKSEYRTLDELLDGFYEVGLKVFCDDIAFERATGSSSNDNTDTLTDENYLERFGSRFPECAELYEKLLNDLRIRIPSVTAYGVGSNGYVYWTADGVRKKGFVDLSFKKDGLHLTTETPTEPVLIDVGRQMDKDNHHKHYYEIVYNESEHNRVLDVLVDAYNQMKSSQD